MLSVFTRGLDIPTYAGASYVRSSRWLGGWVWRAWYVHQAYGTYGKGAPI